MTIIGDKLATIGDKLPMSIRLKIEFTNSVTDKKSLGTDTFGVAQLTKSHYNGSIEIMNKFFTRTIFSGLNIHLIQNRGRETRSVVLGRSWGPDGEGLWTEDFHPVSPPQERLRTVDRYTFVWSEQSSSREPWYEAPTKKFNINGVF